MAFALLIAACAPAPPVPPSVPPATQAPASTPSSVQSPGPATLIVTQAFIGEGFYTEGAFAYVELWDPAGDLIEQAETDDYRLEQELARFTVDAGRYDLRSYVRSCNAACPALDAPSAACAASVELGPADEVTVRIERSIRTCEVTLP
jgi:hypothetical protein